MNNIKNYLLENNSIRKNNQKKNNMKQKINLLLNEYSPCNDENPGLKNNSSITQTRPVNENQPQYLKLLEENFNYSDDAQEHNKNDKLIDDNDIKLYNRVKRIIYRNNNSNSYDEVTNKIVNMMMDYLMMKIKIKLIN